MKMSGKVIEGKKLGRELGYPTANIRITPGIFEGIYAGLVEFDSKKYKAAIYVSVKDPHILEAHLLSFSGDIYGKKIVVSVGDKIREDINETDTNRLREIIKEDLEKIKCLPES